MSLSQDRQLRRVERSRPGEQVILIGLSTPMIMETEFVPWSLSADNDVLNDRRGYLRNCCNCEKEDGKKKTFCTHSIHPILSFVASMLSWFIVRNPGVVEIKGSNQVDNFVFLFLFYKCFYKLRTKPR